MVYWRNKRKEDPCLVFETFLKALIMIARPLYRDLKPMEAFIRFHDYHFEEKFSSADNIKVCISETQWESDLKLIRTFTP